MAFRSLTPIFLAVFALLGMSGAVSVLPPPENVRVVSEDLGLTLVWDPPSNTSHDNLTYTTELSSGQAGSEPTWLGPVCAGERRRSCDITTRKSITAFGSYFLRVRAELQELYSNWSTTPTAFIMDEMTNISAPSVKLFETSGDIEVQLTDPIMKINNFQEMYHPVKYVITYWKQGETHKFFPHQSLWQNQPEESWQSHVILPAYQLSAGNYCVEAHIVTYNNKSSAHTQPTCITYSPDGAVLVLSPPENVRVVSEDLGLTLVWDPPSNTSHDNLTYTTELGLWQGNSRPVPFRSVCVHERRQICDIIAMKTASDISAFGIFFLRVRAELQDLYSDWSTTPTEFAFDKMTNISAPSVRLFETAGDIEVQLMDPVMAFNNFQEVYHPVKYIIKYWKQGETHKKRQEESQQSHVILPANQLSTPGNYCVKAHILMPIYGNKSSAHSQPTCINYSPNGVVSWWMILLLMIGSFLAVGVAVVILFLIGSRCYRTIRYINPKTTLPDIFKQVVPESSVSSDKVELYDKCSIFTPDTHTEKDTHTPPDTHTPLDAHTAPDTHIPLNTHIPLKMDSQPDSHTPLDMDSQTDSHTALSDLSSHIPLLLDTHTDTPPAHTIY